MAFQTGINFSTKKPRHEISNYHEIAQKTANGIIDMVENPKSAVPAQYKSTLDSRIKKYPKIIKIMHLFGGQNLPIKRISPVYSRSRN